MKRSLKVANIGAECVACGCCISVCPRNALLIDRGITARLDEDQCIGCGKCARECPAGVIIVTERRNVYEKEVV